MTLEMRELKGDDLFTLLSIVGKLDIKDEFVRIFENNTEAMQKVVPLDHLTKKPTKAQLDKAEADKAKAAAEAEKRGMEAMVGMLQKVLLNIKNIKGDINNLLSEMTGEDLQTIKDLNLKDYTGLVIAFFKKPELADFFSSIASLLA